MKKVPEAERTFKKIWVHAWCSHGTSNCYIPSLRQTGLLSLMGHWEEHSENSCYTIGIAALDLAVCTQKLMKGRSKGIKPFTSHSNVPQIKLKKIRRNTKIASAPNGKRDTWPPIKGCQSCKESRKRQVRRKRMNE